MQRADADPLLAQLLCLMPTGIALHVSVIGGVILPSEMFTVCIGVFLPLLNWNLEWHFSGMIFLLI